MAHFPYLGTLSLEQINMLCQTVQKYPEQLTRAVLEKIAEIEPWEESYDKNMLKIIMQDGNTVFSNYDSLFMLSEYQTFLPNLEGTNVCLSLDGEFGVIAKQACSGFYTDPLQKAQNRTIPKEALGQKVEENKPEDEKPQEDAQPESQPQESQPSQENPQPASEDTEQTQLPETEQKTRVETDDWQECSYSWLVYSPSKDVYQSKYSDDQYVYDDTIKAFRTLE